MADEQPTGVENPLEFKIENLRVGIHRRMNPARCDKRSQACRVIVAAAYVEAVRHAVRS